MRGYEEGVRRGHHPIFRSGEEGVRRDRGGFSENTNSKHLFWKINHFL